MTRILGSSRSAIVAARRVRRRQDDYRTPRPAAPSLRNHRDRKRQLALQPPRLSATPACPGGQTGTSHARRSVAREGTARRARGPPVRYRDKPVPRPVRGPFSMPIRGPDCVPFDIEAGRDGFCLARWLNARGVEAHVIHPSSVAVSREHRRAKTDRLDTELLKRGFLGWLRGERGHCSMARVPTIAEEDAKRPNRERECLVGERTRIVNRMKATLARLGIRNFKPTLRKAAERLATVHTPEGTPLPRNVLAELQRDMARLGFVVSQIREIEQARQKRLEQETETGPDAMVRRLARVVGVGIETADMLVHEVLSRPLRDRRAVARYAGLTGAPDESGAQRREQGLARAGNARVRREIRR